MELCLTLFPVLQEEAGEVARAQFLKAEPLGTGLDAAQPRDLRLGYPGLGSLLSLFLFAICDARDSAWTSDVMRICCTHLSPQNDFFFKSWSHIDC